jgi:hypothetical protein
MENIEKIKHHKKTIILNLGSEFLKSKSANYNEKEPKIPT